MSLWKEYSTCLPASRRHVFRGHHLEIVTHSGGTWPFPFMSVYRGDRFLPTSACTQGTPAMTEMVRLLWWSQTRSLNPLCGALHWAPGPQAGQVGSALGWLSLCGS